MSKKACQFDPCFKNLYTENKGGWGHYITEQNGQHGAYLTNVTYLIIAANWTDTVGHGNMEGHRWLGVNYCLLIDFPTGSGS